MAISSITCARRTPRKLWVLRGDKLFYSMLSEPAAGYKDHAHSEEEVLALLAKFDPEWIVVEDPQVHYELPGATMLRAVLAAIRRVSVWKPGWMW